jgi:hypothetical protein
MCLSCGGMWPWGNAVHLADAPTKDEYIFLDQNHSFYKDTRTVSQPSSSVLPHLPKREISTTSSHRLLPLSHLPSSIISRSQRHHRCRPYLRPSLPIMPSYYTYDERHPSTLNDPDAPATVQWEDSRDWPRTYTVTSPNAGYQGYHPPAPVYQSSQPAQYQQYYYGQAVSTLSSRMNEF